MNETGAESLPVGGETHTLSSVVVQLLRGVIMLLSPLADQDLTVTDEAFTSLDIPVKKVYITENEVNLLAFPAVSEAMVLFGAGYGFETLAAAHWLHRKEVFSWGDIDTHGFAIHDQLRGFFPHVVSLLMDAQTLTEHRTLWSIEERPGKGDLSRLRGEETILYEQLRRNHWGDRVRLEQEKIGFAYLSPHFS